MLVHDRHTTGVLIGAKTMYIDISTKSKIKLPYEVDKSFLVPLNVNLFNNFKRQTIQSIDYCLIRPITTKVFFEKIRFEVQLDGSGIIQIRFDYQTVNAFVWNTETTKYHENLDAMNYFQQKETIDNSVFWSYDLFYYTFCQISQNKAFRMIKSNYFSDFGITN